MIKVATGGGRICRGILAITCALSCSSCGPHMNTQQSIHPYKTQMPTMPSNSVPTTGKLETITITQTQAVTNPLPSTPNNINNGKIYYGYYCAMCHGTAGDGNGPVGQSYVPKPTDLTSPAIAALPDAELYRRMLHGIGHDPVMDQTVLPQHRWFIVAYVKTFAGKP